MYVNSKIIKKSITTGRTIGNSNSNILSEEEFEDIKGVIRIRKSKKDRQHND
jgi:hypothetical protein